MIITSVKMFAAQIGWPLSLLFFMTLLAGIAEGFGVSMILPLLESDIAQSETMLGRLINGMFTLINLPTTGTNILIMLVVFFFIRAALFLVQTWYQAAILANHLTKIRGKLIQSIFKTNYTHLATYDAGYLTNGLTRELSQVNLGVRQLIDVIVALITASIYIVLPILIQPILTLFLLALAIPISGLSFVLIRKTRLSSVKYTELHGRQQAFFIEGIRNAKYLKATERVGIISDRMILETTRVSNTFRKFLIFSGISRYAPEPIVVFVMAAVIIIYTRGFDHSITEILFLMFLFYQSAKNMLKVQASLRKFTEAIGSLRLHENLRSNLDAHAAIEISEKKKPNIHGDITLSKITVTYPGSQNHALQEIDLKIPSRSTVALVGASGSGKTTVANLLCGLINPASGEISIDGDSYQSISIPHLQQSIGYVTQESAVFNGTLTENITLWESKPDIKRVKEIIEELELQKIGVESNDTSGINNTIAADGAQLSGGERQRLSIARELYRNPTLMILDEATSALDTNLEKKIDDLLESQRGNKTFVVIAHRLSSIKNADLIYVLDKGEVIESGGFDDLANANNVFSRMIRSQEF